MNDILNKFCIRTFGTSNLVTEIGMVTKVANRTIHVDWGVKKYVYQNKDFKWIPLTKEEVEKKYPKSKFTEDSLKRALAFGLEIKGTERSSS